MNHILPVVYIGWGKQEDFLINDHLSEIYDTWSVCVTPWLTSCTDGQVNNTWLHVLPSYSWFFLIVLLYWIYYSFISVAFFWWCIVVNRLVSKMQVPLEACCEPAGKFWQLWKELYVFEHKMQYLLIHAPYTRIVIFWHISNIPPVISKSQICLSNDSKTR